ncbi:MAG: response regulator transcription factor [Nitrospirota bacterium]|nr:response regulator transcription factor [Nitrospirota bacterium]
MSKIRVIIVDDHSLVREGIAAFLKCYDNIEVIAEASNGLEAIEKTRQLHPDIVLMDVAMPTLGGLEATVEIRKNDPSVKILVLTQYDDKEYILRFLKAGVSGYLLKKAVGSDLISAITAIMAGETYLYPAIASKVVNGFLGKELLSTQDSYDLLTDREKQVLKLVAEGHTHKEIAEMLSISPKTVIAHQTNLCEKLGLSNKSDIIKFAFSKAIIK